METINNNVTTEPSSNLPKLQIIAQPNPQHRFRYHTEFKTPTSDGEKFSAHGALRAQQNESGYEWPTVRLLNFKGTAIIHCSLYQMGEIEKLHPNYLWRKTDNGTIEKSPIKVNVNETNNWTAKLTGMAIIIQTKQSDIKGYNNKKKKNENENKIEYDRVKMGFDAFAQTNDQTWIKIAGPEFSIQIGHSSEMFIQYKIFSK